MTVFGTHIDSRARSLLVVHGEVDGRSNDAVSRLETVTCETHRILVRL